MPVKPVQISIDTELLRRIDEDSETQTQGRSSFVRSAIELYLRVKDRKRIEAQLREAYRGQAEVLAAEVSDLIEAQAATRVNRGEIWMLNLPRPGKRRPVVILSRASLIGLLNTVTVAAVTSNLRGSPTEVAIGTDEGLKTTSCVNLCNLFTVQQADLRTFVGTLSAAKMREVCQALLLHPDATRQRARPQAAKRSWLWSNPTIRKITSRGFISEGNRDEAQGLGFHLSCGANVT